MGNSIYTLKPENSQYTRLAECEARVKKIRKAEIFPNVWIESTCKECKTQGRIFGRICKKCSQKKLSVLMERLK